MSNQPQIWKFTQDSMKTKAYPRIPSVYEKLYGSNIAVDSHQRANRKACFRYLPVQEVGKYFTWWKHLQTIFFITLPFPATPNFSLIYAPLGLQYLILQRPDFSRQIWKSSSQYPSCTTCHAQYTDPWSYSHITIRIIILDHSTRCLL